MKPNITTLVREHLEHLRVLDSRALWGFARQHGIRSRQAFARFRDALLEQGIDLDAMRRTERVATEHFLAGSCTHEIELFADANARAGKFAICDRAGKPVWHGRFFDGEGQEQSDAELCAAKKAIWLAGKIRERAGAEAAKLVLVVDAQWLTSLSGKAAVLGTVAKKENLILEILWVPGTSNPADPWTTTPGYQKYTAVDLRSLAVPVRQSTGR